MFWVSALGLTTHPTTVELIRCQCFHIHPHFFPLPMAPPFPGGTITRIPPPPDSQSQSHSLHHFILCDKLHPLHNSVLCTAARPLFEAWNLCITCTALNTEMAVESRNASSFRVVFFLSLTSPTNLVQNP